MEISIDQPPTPMDDVDCDALLTEAEVEAILGTDVRPVGRRASSCYWTGRQAVVQLVFNTSDLVDGWRGLLLETYTVPLDTAGVEVRGERDSESVAAFGPDRGVIVHGVRARDQAIALCLLALSRL